MSKIKVSVDGPVRLVTLARGEKRNALDAEMLDELKRAFAAPPAASERVTVIRAEGPVFCAGLDLRERDGGRVGSGAIEAMLHAIEVYPLPVVAVVQGDAIAGGNELAFHCDIVVALAPGLISVIGGNVDDAVTMKHVPVTPDGKLATPDGTVLDTRYPWMVVLRVLYPAAPGS